MQTIFQKLSSRIQPNAARSDSTAGRSNDAASGEATADRGPEDTMVAQPSTPVRKVVSSPFPANLQPVNARKVAAYPTAHAAVGSGCLNVLREQKEVFFPTGAPAVDFSKQMVLTYVSEDDCSSGGHTLALKAAGVGANGALHLLTQKSCHADVTWSLEPRTAEFVVPRVDGDIVLHIEPGAEVCEADSDSE